MAELRDMELLVALARFEHFGRAAEACGISQPALSTRIQRLEHDLGAPIVRRGNRFAGFTPEGEIALSWARRLTRNAEGMRQDMAAACGTLTGKLAIGSVPTALPFAAQLPARLRERAPGLSLRLRSASSVRIRQGLEDLSLDAGITYASAEMPRGIVSRPLYDERYVVLAPPGLCDPGKDEITWSDAAALPLCLLSEDMRNRRIVDSEFARQGLAPTPILQTNDFTAAIAQVAEGSAATIAPEVLADVLPQAPGIKRQRLVAPVLSEPMVLVYLEQDPEPPALGVAIEELLGLAR